jgi:hypothetical protein
MPEKYEVQRTSLQSAAVSEKVLSETSTTRLVMRPEIVENPHNADARVKITLVHQRKSAKGTWEDAATTPFSTLKAGEEVKMPLHTEQTLELFRQLDNLFTIATKGKIGFGKTSLVVGREEEVIQTDAGRATVIKLLLSKGYSDDIWRTLVTAYPDLATQLSYARIHAERQKALEEFRENLTRKQGEDWWQAFFERNKWIFGYGLKYQILKPLQAQPNYGGAKVSGKGMEKGDFLERTEAEVKFTVLVEIKKPDTPLLGPKQYRNAAWQLGEDLAGGVAQLQANCRRWEIEGAQTEKNRENLRAGKIFTVQPRGILVIGHTGQLADLEKRNTFELFRRNVVNPEILTFDELYERAKFIVEHTGERKRIVVARPQVAKPVVSTDDNIPF